MFFLHRVKATWDSEGARNMYRMLRDATVGPSSSKSIDIFEDNDPVWKKDEGWKRENKIVTCKVPARSPDLNPLDFSINHAMDRLLLQQDKKIGNARISNASYCGRIEKTARSRKMLSICRNAINSMRRRLQRVVDGDGELLDW